MKFVVVNSFNREDKGDAALLDSLLRQLSRIDPNANIAISSMEDPAKFPSFIGRRNLGSFELYSSSWLYPMPWHLCMKIYVYACLFLVGATRGRLAFILNKRLRTLYQELKSADLVVSVGGGYFLTRPNWGSRMHLLFAVTTLKFCKQIGCTVATAPVSVGPFQDTYIKNFAVRNLKKIDLLLLREDISRDFFKDQDGTVPANVHRLPDSAFEFAPEGDYPLRTIAGATDGDHVLALSVRKGTGGENQAAYEQSFADLLDFIAANHPTIRPVFVPQCTEEHGDDDDRRVAHSILQRSTSKRAVVIDDDLDYKTVKLAYKQADMVIGTRFHAMIFSLTYNVPGIAIEYEHKTRGIMRDLQLEPWVIKMTEITGPNLIAMFKKLTAERQEYIAHLERVMPPYKQKAHAAVDMFKDLLK